MQQYRFDDVQGLQSVVSEQWGEWSNPFTVTQAVIQQFADLTNDHNWIHLDVERCKKEIHSFPTRRSSEIGRAACRERV